MDRLSTPGGVASELRRKQIHQPTEEDGRTEGRTSDRLAEELCSERADAQTCAEKLPRNSREYPEVSKLQLGMVDFDWWRPARYSFSRMQPVMTTANIRIFVQGAGGPG